MSHLLHHVGGNIRRHRRWRRCLCVLVVGAVILSNPVGDRGLLRGQTGSPSEQPKENQHSKPRILKGHDKPACAVVLSPDGKTVVSAGSSDKTIRFWDAATGKQIRIIENAHGDTVHGLAISPDGKTVASGGYRAVCLWDLATGKELRTLDARYALVDVSDVIMAVAFSPDGKLLAASGSLGMMSIWDMPTGKWLRQVGRHPGQVTSIAFSSDSKLLAGGCYDGKVWLWDPATGNKVRALVGPGGGVFPVAFSPDGKTLACGHREGTVQLWDYELGEIRRQFKGHKDGVLSLAFAPSGREIASAGVDGKVRLWEVLTGRERRCFSGHKGVVRSVAFSADGRTLASGADDLTLRVWDTLPVDDAVGQDVDTLWAALAEADAQKAYRATLGLARDPKQAVPLLDAKLKGVSTDVSRITRLIANLNSSRFKVRENAANELIELADQAEPALRKALAAHPPMDRERRLKEILAKVREKNLSGERLRLWRSVEVLERISGSEAEALLERLAKGGSDDPLAQEAKAALRRLRR
jgi:WD40 repeat protein